LAFLKLRGEGDGYHKLFIKQIEVLAFTPGDTNCYNKFDVILCFAYSILILVRQNTTLM